MPKSNQNILQSHLPLLVEEHSLTLCSKHLKRKITLTVIVPPNYAQAFTTYPVLYCNDGQDLERMKMSQILSQLYQNQSIPQLIMVGMHADKNRIQEYGTASEADYAKRGSKAELHTKFLLQELMPFMTQKYRIKQGAEHTFLAGFSLGGLSAIDIIWHHPDKFSKVGVFSGALWWRSKPYEEGFDEDKDRIIHNLIRNGKFQANLQFWFQAGTEDEKEDRNQNGIIDAIDDTLDLIKELHLKGYNTEQVVYYEMEGGTHDPETWAKAMPVFLEWLFKSPVKNSE